MQLSALLLTIIVAQWSFYVEGTAFSRPAYPEGWACQALGDHTDQWWALRCNKGEVQCFTLDGKTCAASPTGRDCNLLAMYQNRNGRPIAVQCDADAMMADPGHWCHNLKTTMCADEEHVDLASLFTGLATEEGANGLAAAVLATLTAFVIGGSWAVYRLARPLARRPSWQFVPECQASDEENPAAAKLDHQDVTVPMKTP